MSKQEKCEVLAEILEVEEDEVLEDALLEDFESWDSVAVLSIIAEIQERKGVFMHADDIVKLKTVKDIFDLFD